ncbi:MAG TPA: VIT and VWA domain-containing protein, partial [Pyrinomonadaceae bacterium]|nr:VIT and VWA domain-containing protein [Pyrinomonadaceae bacterium]
MRHMKAPLLIILALLMFAGFSQKASAQGIIVPGPCTRCPERPRAVQLPRSLPIKSIKIDTKIINQVATTHVEQIFSNETDATLEGTYFFPIPDEASIAEFAIWDGERRLVGEVRSREEARRVYDEIVRRMRDPGLLEYAGRNLFQASIFPILAHSEKKLEITYTQVLRAESGTVSYKYPLGTGQNIVQIGAVSGRVEIEGNEPVRNIYSPSHAVDVKRNNERRATLSFESSGGQQQDFQLFYSLSREDFGMTLLTYREPGRDGYFLLMISPKQDWSEQEYTAKDIVFVIDTSGSMAEEGKMQKARAALLFGVRNLRAEDRFNIVSFAGEEHLMENGLIAATPQGRSRGEDFVNSLRPNGGTNINDALQAAMKQFDHSARPKIIVFLTDGLPTVGETAPQRIINNSHRAEASGVRLFTFGVGYDVNTNLLDRLASENGGVADYVEPREDLEIKVSNFFTKINSPVLTDLHLDMGGVETDLVYPRSLPDLFKGSQITLIGRYRSPAELSNVQLRLAGRAAGRERTFAYEGLRFPIRETKNDFLPRLWATRRVGWLLEQIRSNGEQRELRDEIVELGTRYGIVTPYTSYLAVESQSEDVTRAAAVNGGRAADQSRGAPNEAPRRQRALAQPPSSATVNATTGAAAVAQSKNTASLQNAESLDDNDAMRISTVRNVGGRTFYLRSDVWV